MFYLTVVDFITRKQFLSELPCSCIISDFVSIGSVNILIVNDHFKIPSEPIQCPSLHFTLLCNY